MHQITYIKILSNGNCTVQFYTHYENNLSMKRRSFSPSTVAHPVSGWLRLHEPLWDREGENDKEKFKQSAIIHTGGARDFFILLLKPWIWDLWENIVKMFWENLQIVTHLSMEMYSPLPTWNLFSPWEKLITKAQG